MLDPGDTVPVGDAVATVGAVCVPHHVGVCSCREPALEIDNWLEEAGTKASHGQNTRTHCIHHLRLTLKEKMQATKRELYKEPILGQDYQDRKSDLTPKLTHPMS